VVYFLCYDSFYPEYIKKSLNSGVFIIFLIWGWVVPSFYHFHIPVRLSV